MFIAAHTHFLINLIAKPKRCSYTEASELHPFRSLLETQCQSKVIGIVIVYILVSDPQVANTVQQTTKACCQKAQLLFYIYINNSYTADNYILNSKYASCIKLNMVYSKLLIARFQKKTSYYHNALISL